MVHTTKTAKNNCETVASKDYCHRSVFTERSAFCKEKVTFFRIKYIFSENCHLSVIALGILWETTKRMIKGKPLHRVWATAIRSAAAFWVCPKEYPSIDRFGSEQRRNPPLVEHPRQQSRERHTVRVKPYDCNRY